ncbi:MAG: hypothetical protein GWN62_25680 [Aliifodinibius sp.]|nr:hypothetical protein [Fodinibius sp.]
MAKYKIENCDGSAFIVTEQSLRKVKQYAVNITRAFDGPVSVYQQRDVHTSLNYLVNPINWLRIGYAEDGEWFNG